MNNFYKNSNLILQTEFSIPWTPRGFGKVSDTFHIKSKIGLKGNIGINITKNNKITFRDFYFWSNESKKYEIDNSIVNSLGELENYLNNYLLENNIKFGLEINFLSDIARGHGFGFSGVFSSILSTSIFLLLGKIDNNFNDLEKNKELIDFSFNIESILRNKNTNGLNSLSSFINNKNPILFYSNKGELNYEKFIEEDFDFPVDYYVIFSGVNTETKKIENLIKNNGKEIDNISTFIKNKLDKLSIKNHYLENFSEKEFISKNFENLFHFINLKQVNNFEIFSKNNYDNRNIEDFIRNIDEYRKINNILGEYSEFLNIFEKSFYKNKKSLQNNIGIMPIYGGKIGGGYLVVSKENTNRDIIEQTVEDISIYFPNSYIEYCSYKNNKKIEGIKLIQNIEENIFHNSLIGENYRLKTINKTIIVVDLKEALEMSFDILFDINKGKAYIKGKKLTSKDIHSQNILVEVISKIFDKQGKWVSNKIFNKSSYSETKSLMGSKVVYPFIKLIKKILGKDIIFDIYGIGGEFELKINFGKIKVGLLDKF